MSGDTRQTLDAIVGMVRDGRIDAALDLCRESLSRQSEDVNLLGMLGAILLKKGEWEDAERTLKRTLEIEPAFAKPHEDLGILYLKTNQPGKAVAFFERAIALDPDALSARWGLAAALQRAGRHEEAALLQDADARPSPAAAMLAEADAARRRGDSRRAEQLCQEIVEKEPQNLAALRQLAMLATEAGQFVIAENFLRRILEISPRHVGALLDLGRFLGQRGRYPEAIEVLEDAATLHGEHADLQLLRGDMLAIIGRSADALRAYEHCLSLRPDDPQALLGCGHMLRIEGRREAAQAAYRRCATIRPEIGDAWWNLASLRGYTPADADIAQMEAELEKSALPPESEVAFRFALARACETRCDYEHAWQHYAKGNALQRGLVKYDPVEIELQQRKIMNAFTEAVFSREPAATPADRTPVFILGMPRSGSTLIEQILASHSQVEGTGELPYIIMLTKTLAANEAEGLHYPEVIAQLDSTALTGLGRSYLHYARTHYNEGKPFFTDKMPANFAHAGFIRLILPHAKIIDARREPVAACVANYRQLYAQGKNQSYDLAELGEYYLQYVAIMDHWGNVMPGSVLRIQYEDVVADLEAQVRRILDFCELPFEQNCVEYHRNARPVNTASSEQVREPIYTSAVNFWRHYEAHLNELTEILAPVLR